MLARRFLYIVAALIIIVIAAGIAWNLFADQLLRVAFVPSAPWSAPTAPAPDYAKASSWYARPAGADDRHIAVFYVLPTTALTKAHWNVAADDHESADRQKMFFDDQAQAFAAVGDIWAPRYRQAVIGAFLANDADGGKAIDFAYRDVERAFAVFLKQIPTSVPILLAGHSQGSLHLIRLLREHVAGTPLARRIVAAYLPGWPISIAHDLPALGLPACRSASQANCILSWQSFARPADPRHIVTIYDASTGFDGKPRKGSAMLCVNPLSGAADTRFVPARANLGARVGGKLAPRRVPAGCTAQGFLDIGDPPNGYADYVMPGNNYHVFDYGLFWSNIRADAETRSRAFHK